MKQILLLSGLMLSNIFYAQAQSRKFVMLDMLDSVYRVAKYTLDTKALYGTDHHIELYNVWLSNELVLFSVLPDFSRSGAWEKVDTAKLEGRILSKTDFRRDMQEKYLVEGSEKKSMHYALIKRMDGDFYVSKNCLLEYFNIRNYPPELHTPYGTINTGQSKLTIKEMAILYQRHFPDSPFPLDILQQPAMGDQLLLRREYLSKQFELNGEKAYQFWTFIDWNMSDGRNTQRGIDRFIYMPSKGIVGGSYDFYFFFKAKLDFTPDKDRYIISMNQWQDNIMEEKVMLAEELK
ncbi:hypothetical protein [Parapedobacter sp. 10938]|uniref:hypothetical protein n=1 Tax=Parapedobacter flavus TaxID=3110225 RepID=UPI002DBBD928|nr:hypothetical protein [Parapedobacter sp. 10938]MEC3878772.1 hypothetical protein [Parapedobacter sp. 10938]